MNIKEKDALNNLVKNALYGIHMGYYSAPLSIEAAQRDNERPGFLIISNYNPNNLTHTENIVNGSKHELVNREFSLDGGEFRKLLGKLIHQDGALLVGKEREKGKVYRVGARLKNHNVPLKVPDDKEEWEALGFSHEVGTRHINALYASTVMPGTSIWTLSGKTGTIRRYEEGRIVQSTLKPEIFGLEERVA